MTDTEPTFTVRYRVVGRSLYDQLAEWAEQDIPDSDLRVDTSTNMTGSVVKVTHLPTGIVTEASGQSRHTATAEALNELRSLLAER